MRIKNLKGGVGATKILLLSLVVGGYRTFEANFTSAKSLVLYNMIYPEIFEIAIAENENDPSD